MSHPNSGPGPRYSGSCLCGGIQYAIYGELEAIQVCHCQQCRKAQGAPLATNIPVLASNFVIKNGQELLKEYESSSISGKYRVFCKNCGSPIISRLDSKPEVVRIRAVTLNEAIPSEIAFHSFISEKANWWPIDDDLPQFDKFADH